MRLTKYDKEAFVKAVVDDIPTVDYNEIASKKARDWLNTLIPEAILVLIKTHGANYFRSRHVSLPAHLADIQAFGPSDFESGKFIQVKNPELWAELVELGQKKHEQEQAIDAMRRQARGVIESCHTLKSAKERLPEFEKYLPKERSGSGITTLPVANFVADLVQAGWPKDKTCSA